MEKAYFLQLIGDYINNRKSPLISNEEEEICSYAIQHQLAPIIYFQTHFSQLESFYYSALSASTNRKKLDCKIKTEFDSANIIHFPVKGSEIAKYYPHQALRTMGDTDIVVKDIKKADEKLRQLGCDIINKSEGHEWQYRINNLEYEIHSALIYDSIYEDTRLSDFMNDCWEYVEDNELNASFHFIYVLVHLRKHLMKRGVGFRQFLDVAVLIKNCNELDWIWIKEKLTEIELLQFAQTVFAFIKRWWSISAPMQQIEILDDFYDNTTDYIFSNGVFGFKNKDNENYQVAHDIVTKGKFGRIKRFISLLFPSYQVMCAENKMAFLPGRPYLLPIAWILRIFKSVLKGNVTKKVQYVTSANLSNGYIDKREKMLRQWGLTG